MGALQDRIDKARAAREGTVIKAETSTGAATVSPWVKVAQEGARIGQPLNGQGLPVRVDGGSRG